MVDPFSCPTGSPGTRSGAGGAASTTPPAHHAPRDIVDIVATMLVPGDPQSMRYILTDHEGVKYYSNWTTTIPGPGKVNTDWFALSFGYPTQIIKPPAVFTPAVIQSKNIDPAALKGLLTKEQLQIATSLNSISRLTYAQEFLGAPTSKIPNADQITDIEFETRSTSVGAPVFEMGQVYARVNFTDAQGHTSIADVVIDDFEQPGASGNSASVGSSIGSIKKTIASQTGTSSSSDGLCYTSLEYNSFDNSFVTINTAGFDQVVKVSPGGFAVVGTNFGLGGMQRDGIAMSPVANFVYVAEGHSGTVYTIPLSGPNPPKTVIANNLNLGRPNPVFPITECDVNGDLIVQFGNQYYRVTSSGQVTNLGQGNGGNTLARAGSEFFVSYGSKISKLNLADLSFSETITLDANIFSLVARFDATLFYAVEQNVSSTPNPAGTQVVSINRATKLKQVVYTAPSGMYIYGIVSNGTSVFALLASFAASDTGAPARVEVDELVLGTANTFVAPVGPPTQTAAQGSAPAGWTASGTGGALLGTLGDNTDTSTAQRIILSKIPPGGGCQMYYKQVQWYERGWRINACCGAWIELNGVQWLIVKRSIGIDTTCGGGESENTICIQQYVASGQGHPAIAWPTVDGQEFLGLPTSGFINFIKDNALSATLLDKLDQNDILGMKGDPVANIPFILFPAP